MRDALKASKKIGVGQLAMRGQEYVVALKPCGKGLLLETLRYADEVNKAQSYFREIGDTKPDADLLDMASMLIERKAGKFDPKEFHNRYVDALHRLIEEKQKAKGQKIIEDPDAGAPPPRGSNVVDLMAALKRSLGNAEEGGKAANENKGAAPKKRTAAKKSAPRHAPKKAPAKKAAGGRRR
jgi:DNA end-binding protein Ku